jgi:hypothetical protein
MGIGSRKLVLLLLLACILSTLLLLLGKTSALPTETVHSSALSTPFADTTAKSSAPLGSPFNQQNEQNMAESAGVRHGRIESRRLRRDHSTGTIARVQQLTRVNRQERARGRMRVLPLEMQPATLLEKQGPPYKHQEEQRESQREMKLYKQTEAQRTPQGETEREREERVEEEAEWKEAEERRWVWEREQEAAVWPDLAAKGGCVQRRACAVGPLVVPHFPISGGSSLHLCLHRELQRATNRTKVECPLSSSLRSIRWSTYTSKLPATGVSSARQFCEHSALLSDEQRARLWSHRHWTDCLLHTTHDDVSLEMMLPCSNQRMLLLLRDPVERTWSAWHKNWHVNRTEHGSDPLRWLRSPMFRQHFRYEALYFYAGVSEVFPRTFHSADVLRLVRRPAVALALAKERLRDAWLVGTTDRLAQMCATAVQGLLRETQIPAQHLPFLTMPHDHHNTARPPIPAEVRAELKRLLHDELELYQYARELHGEWPGAAL